MNEDINLRIKFIQEVERHPYLYDNNHVLYNHRDKIEATWKKIGQMFGEESADCKKKWRLIRCSYTRSLKMQTNKKSSSGMVLAKGYYMAPHLRFLDPFLRSRSFNDTNLSEEEESYGEESMEAVDGNSIIRVTLDDVKVERTESDHDYEVNEVLEDHMPLQVPKRRHDDEGANLNLPTKRIRLQEQERKDMSPNEMYLLSLNPYLETMTERQKLAFQKGVVELIEKIKYDT